MVGINNGDAIFCIIMVLDSLARSNNSIVEIETLHTELCPLLTSTEGGAGAEMIQDDSMPDIISTKVVFPAPDGPFIRIRSPLFIFKETFCKTFLFEYE